MGTTRIIPPKANFPSKLKVAAYCRVSTNAAKRLSSLAMQEQYYEKHIKQNPDWIFAGVYSDIGSGTRIKGRNRFKALLSACRHGKVDMILIKSAHRFARNTVDALKTIRMLRSRNIDIYFERENIHTLYESSEFVLMLVCALAQDESYSKSEDIKWGLRKSFQNPDSKYYQRVCYGYTHDQDGNLIIHEEQAEIVRLIYEMFASGVSLARISAYLEDMGILSPRGKEVWSKETLRKILSNEKYMGTVTLQKTFVENHLEHKQIKNIGQLDIFQIDCNHKPIIYVDS
ncbi:recombinase family protein [uncultured Oscillibacter sp.]|uniref:recombinase family protein n=1 Tax=uncultured Oscillibacter sp. TaxID=876091 RepID=UPI0025F7885F|nr:recombinase family protein [uncultured Oscillibacter sp.]